MRGGDPDRRSPAHRHDWLAALIAFAVLNLALGIHNVWPTFRVTTRWELSVEAAMVVLVIVVLRAVRGRVSRRATWVLAGLVLVLLVARYADVTSRALYGRSINLYWDMQHLPDIAAMMARAASPLDLALVLAGIAAGAVALALLARWLIASLAGGLHAGPVRTAFVAVSVLMISTWSLARAAQQDAIASWFAAPVTASALSQLSLLADALSARSSEDFRRDPLADSSLANVRDADVVIVFIESYGATTLDDPAYRPTASAARARLEAVAARTGYRVASAVVGSPTFGGGSWLAHASLLTGYPVADDRTYRMLLASKREPIVQRFAAAGYRTVGLMPGIRLAWPEGNYYGFEGLYDAQALDYRGLAFGWWQIPDQYSLARADTLELASTDRRPVFMLFPTINSHAPFMPVPPYLDDWHRVQQADAFEGLASPDRDTASAWSDPGAAYARSIDYALQVVGGFLAQTRERDLVLVVVGDHQPAAAVSGPDASHDVPVHVITRRDAVLEPLLAGGFTTGVTPARQAIGSMHELANRLLAAFGGADPAVATAATH